MPNLLRYRAPPLSLAELFDMILFFKIITPSITAKIPAPLPELIYALIDELSIIILLVKTTVFGRENASQYKYIPPPAFEAILFVIVLPDKVTVSARIAMPPPLSKAPEPEKLSSIILFVNVTSLYLMSKPDPGPLSETRLLVKFIVPGPVT